MALTIPYSHRDVVQVLDDLKAKILTLTPNWTGFQDSDVGFALLKTFAASLDLLNFYIDRTAAESYLAASELRASAVALAKDLGYTTTGPSSATTSVRFSLVGAYNEDIVIPAGTSVQLNNLPFFTTENALLPQGQLFTDVTVIQGQRYTLTQTASGARWLKLVLPAAIADVTVVVNSATWTRVASFIYATTRQAYRLYEDADGWVVEFSGGENTDVPAPGVSIVITGTISDGLAGNADVDVLPVTINTPIFNTLNQNIANVFAVVSLSAPTGGGEPESLAHIKQNAPAYYTTQNRTVTEADYEAVAATVPGVIGVSAWGGEKIKRYGETYVAVYGNDRHNVPQSLLDAVATRLAPVHMVPIILKVVAPVIVTVDVAITVYLTPQAAVTPARNAASQAIVAYFASLSIGATVQQSDLLSALAAIPGIDYAAVAFTAHVPGNISVGLLTVPTIQYADTDSLVVVRGADGVTLWATADGNYSFFDNTLAVPLAGTAVPVSVTVQSKYPDLYVLRNQLAATGLLTVTSRLSGQPE